MSSIFADIRHPQVGAVAPSLLFVLLVPLAGLALDWLAPAYVLALLLSDVARTVLSMALTGAGIALTAAAWQALARSGGELPWQPPFGLVTDGPYAWMRNPFDLGLALFTAGISVALTSDWTMVLLITTALSMHFGAIRREERALEARFGNAYRSYKLAVPRYGISS